MAQAGVLLLNLGSPDSTRVEDVRAYLKEFLSDPRVIDKPKWVRDLVLNLFILPKRPAESAEAYRTIWTEEGSPLVVTSQRQRDLFAAAVDVPVYLGMRYGQPSTPDAVRQAAADGVRHLFIMPLYPHYAMSSYETAVVRAMEAVAASAPEMETTLLQPFFDDPGYIAALVESAAPHLEEEHDLLLFSYHGIPARHLRQTDPSHAHCLTTPGCCQRAHPAHATCYRHQCFRTTEAFVAAAGIPAGKFALSFQSRLGREPWLHPYTDRELERFAREGVRRLLVMCPAFVTDCLETLEEIEIRGAEDFRAAGGESLKLVPCLNQHPAWIRFLADKVDGWLEASGKGDGTPENSASAPAASPAPQAQRPAPGPTP